MKVKDVNYEKKCFIVAIDFWEAESLGLNTKTKEDITGSYYTNILSIIGDKAKALFGDKYKFAVKTYVDEQRGIIIYEVKPYEERLNEFILDEMYKNGRKWIFYDDQMWSLN